MGKNSRWISYLSTMSGVNCVESTFAPKKWSEQDDGLYEMGWSYRSVIIYIAASRMETHTINCRIVMPGNTFSSIDTLGDNSWTRSLGGYM